MKKKQEPDTPRDGKAWADVANRPGFCPAKTKKPLWLLYQQQLWRKTR